MLFALSVLVPGVFARRVIRIALLAAERLSTQSAERSTRSKQRRAMKAAKRRGANGHVCGAQATRAAQPASHRLHLRLRWMARQVS